MSESFLLHPAKEPGLEISREQEQPLDLSNEFAGQTCPQCHQGILEFNGLLDLACPLCGYHEPGGGYT